MAKAARTPERDDALTRLKADIKNGEYQNLYIFCGEEAFLREHYLRLLSGKMTGGPAGAFNEHRFAAENLTPEALADAVEAMPMMAERTFVRVDDVDFYRMAASQCEQYAAVLEDIPEYCCVVLVYDTVAYKPGPEKSRLREVLKKKAFVVDFKKQSERELAGWVFRHFKALGKDISDELCRYLIFLTGGGMTALGSEIGKIAHYCTTPAIARSDIDAVVTPTLSAQSFDISNAIAAGDYDTALRKLQDLFALQEEPVRILGAISSQMRRLYYARVVSGAGKSPQTLMELADIKSSYAAGIAMQSARRVSERFCVQGVELCMRTDIAMKSGGGDPERLLELLIAQLAQEARRV